MNEIFLHSIKQKQKSRVSNRTICNFKTKHFSVNNSFSCESLMKRLVSSFLLRTSFTGWNKFVSGVANTFLNIKYVCVVCTCLKFKYSLRVILKLKSTCKGWGSRTSCSFFPSNYSFHLQ